MARSAGKSEGHMKGHGEKAVRGPRKSGKSSTKGKGKPKDTNPRGHHSILYSDKKPKKGKALRAKRTMK